MNHETRAIIDKVYEHIEKTPFSSVEEMKRDLEVMKHNTDLEWFNCALIAQAKLRNDPVFAFPLHVWAQTFPKENIQPSDPPGDGQIMLLVPRFYITSCSLDFDLIPVFFQDALSVRNLQFSRASKAEYNVRKYRMKWLKPFLPKNWQRKLVSQYLNQLPFYDPGQHSEASFYRDILLFCFQQELMINTAPDLKLGTIPPSKRVEVYQNIHLAVSEFHKAVSQYGKKRWTRNCLNVSRYQTMFSREKMCFNDWIKRRKAVDAPNEMIYLMSQLGFLDRDMFAAYLRKAYGRSDCYKGFVDDYIVHSLDWVSRFKDDSVDKIQEAVDDSEYLFFENVVSDVNYPSMTNPSVAGQYRHGGILHDWT